MSGKKTDNKLINLFKDYFDLRPFQFLNQLELSNKKAKAVYFFLLLNRIQQALI